MNEIMTRKEFIRAAVEITNKLVNNHLTLEKRPLTFEERVDCLHDTQPDLNFNEASLALSVAIAMLVEEREKKKWINNPPANQLVSLLYRMATHIRNTDAVPPVTWGVKGIELLEELKALDPEKYEREIKNPAAAEPRDVPS